MSPRVLKPAYQYNWACYKVLSSPSKDTPRSGLEDCNRPMSAPQVKWAHSHGGVPTIFLVVSPVVSEVRTLMWIGQVYSIEIMGLVAQKHSIICRETTGKQGSSALFHHYISLFASSPPCTPTPYITIRPSITISTHLLMFVSPKNTHFHFAHHFFSPSAPRILVVLSKLLPFYRDSHTQCWSVATYSHYMPN